MKALEYPFDSEYILKKHKSLKKLLLEQSNGKKLLRKKIAILGGSTTRDIRNTMELFLLNAEIEPEFYESEYEQYWNDVMFDNEELVAFEPDIIFIHTSNRNIKGYPKISDNQEEIDALMDSVYQPFEAMWKKIEDKYHCPVIQNNFEQPFYRLLGNKDFADIHGRINFVNRLNQRFALYAQNNDNFYINDINYLAACYGLEKWADPFYWHMYKYACAYQAIPELAYNVVNIIKALYGKNKKAFVLDLDNTLWGGVVGDDGPENIEIGQETSLGQVYSEFQQYIKLHKELGVLLTINSKNDESNALAGLNRPDSVLTPDDFLVIKANWENKDFNIVEIAKELNIGLQSLVFVDDNPVEREIVRTQVPEVAVPDVGDVNQYIKVLDRSGFFEVTTLSSDDLNRNKMYKANMERQRQESSFQNYEEYLKSLEMAAEIQAFVPEYMSRIAQLTNKSNQFNLTTKRYTQSDIEEIAKSADYITLYGKLQDKFGDNGVVSLIVGNIKGINRDELHIDLWLMSCRVLKRNMEFAMMDVLVQKAVDMGIKTIYGYFYPTAKNSMVRDFYELQSFEKLSEDSEGNTVWQYVIPKEYINKQNVISIN